MGSQDDHTGGCPAPWRSSPVAAPDRALRSKTGGMVAVVSPFAHGLCVLVGLVACAAACLGARRRPGTWTLPVARLVL
jgi:hypothetical protein